MIATVLDNERQSGWTYLLILGSLAVIAIVIWLLGKLFPARARTAAGNALMQAEVFFRPSREHVIETKLREDQEDAESADPPEPDSPSNQRQP